MKRTVSLVLSFVLALSLALPVVAAEQYADVGGDEWFADAANALQLRVQSRTSTSMTPSLSAIPSGGVICR